VQQQGQIKEGSYSLWALQILIWRSATVAQFSW